MHSPISYFGGKSRLAKKITRLIPKHVSHIEPFCGAAWVLFQKEPSKVEVVNDLDNDLITFWRVIQNHLAAFLEYFRYAVVSRELFAIENRKDPTTLTDIQKAVRFYYLQRLGYGGKTSGRTFGGGVVRPSSLNLTTIEDVLLEVHWRMKRVTIEHMDACVCIQHYDRPTSFFFIDPPYYHVSQDYAAKFSDKDFIRLRDTLLMVKGKFLLTLNDTQAIRSIFKAFRQVRVSTKYSTGNSNVSSDTRGKDRSELFIHNM